MLGIPKPGEVLYLYLAVTLKTFSIVLVQENDGIQKLIYHVNKALHDAELRYQLMEKVVLALITTARHLRSYFQAHKISVLFDLSLKQVLLTPKASGRMMN